MSELDSRLKDISEIRTLMERSSKFLSLSGLSGVSAGIAALIGVYIAQHKIETQMGRFFLPYYTQNTDTPLIHALLLNAAIILLAALGLAILFSVRMAIKKATRFGIIHPNGCWRVYLFLSSQADCFALY